MVLQQGAGAQRWGAERPRGRAAGLFPEEGEDPAPRKGWARPLPSAQPCLRTDVAPWGLGRCQRSERVEASAVAGLRSCAPGHWRADGAPDPKEGTDAPQEGSSINPSGAAQSISRA